jgi:DNA-binding response OmpR family regulator
MKLLIVGNEPDLLSAAQFLEQSGHHCMTAPDVQQAIDWVIKIKPELVITDFHLPDGVGFQVIRHVREALPQTPVILVSEDLVQGMEEAALEVGAAAYVRKPLNIPALESLIKAVAKNPFS